MRILITADPDLPVPPKHYGGIERVIELLVHGLVNRGQDVTLVAHADSNVSCTLAPYKGVSSQSIRDNLRNAALITKTFAAGHYDVVHSFSRLAYLCPLLPLSIPKLMTYQREITPRSVKLGCFFSRGTLQFTAISKWMIKSAKVQGNWHLVYNGVPTDIYDFVPSVPADAPLVFLGRIEYIKGTHLAIEVAKRTKRRLIIAGNISAGHQEYFDKYVFPHLDGEQISYIGQVSDEQKNVLLGNCSALLMPILWEEPFGIVMAEALACGTPVVGLCRGAVEEVVEDGVTGFVRSDIDTLVDVVGRLGELDRRACRERAETMFSEEAVVESYLSVYRNIATTKN